MARDYISFQKLKREVSRVGISAPAEYRKRYQEILGAPSRPEDIYRNRGWKNWPDLFRRSYVKRPARSWPSFRSLKKSVKRLNIGGETEYQSQYFKIHGAPSNPNLAYRNKGWKGWRDFLGTAIQQPRLSSDGKVHPSVNAARIHDFLIGLGIRTIPECVYGPYQADWFLPDHGVFVEYFGVEGSQWGYKEKIQSKKRFCTRNDLRLIPIYKSDVSKFGRLFEIFKPFARKNI